MPLTVIAGASGLVGSAVLEHYVTKGRQVIAVSRRRPEIDDALSFPHISVDLRNRSVAAKELGNCENVTHLVYAALFEKPGLIQGWTEGEQMETNRVMFRNCLEPLLVSGNLRHVTLLQGTKAYGSHLHEIPISARESFKRDEHENFYWLQEDLLREWSHKEKFAWTILRPQLTIGGAYGVAMNVVLVIGIYAAMCRQLDIPFAFPGGPPDVREIVDARLLARAIEWSGTSECAVNEIFNVTNGDAFSFASIWPALATFFGLEAGSDHPQSFVSFFEGKDDLWHEIVERYRLRKLPLRNLLGQSQYMADHVFNVGASEASPPRLLSRVKLNNAGFTCCQNTQESFLYWLQHLIYRRILPPPDRWLKGGIAKNNSFSEE